MANKNYKHYIPEARLDKSFPDEKEFVLVDSIEKLENCLFNNEKDKGYLAWDTETSDLSPEDGVMVGFSFAFDTKTGYYVPLRHADGGNIEDIDKALDLFYKKMIEVKKNFLFNVRFDFRFMEFEGYDMSEVNYYDCSIGVWFGDTNKKMPSLKWAARWYSGWDMQTFEETLGDNINFQFVDVEDAVDYAGADAIATFKVTNDTLQYFKEGGMAGKVDNKILYPLMKFEDRPLPIDVEYLEGMLTEAQSRIKEIEHDIYSMAGYTFNINSGPQLAKVLDKLGLDTGEYTKSGYMSTKKSLIKELDHPIADKLIEYKNLNKKVNTYIEKLVKYAKENDNKLRFAYKTQVVPTGRLACGGDKKNDYFAKINLQCLTGDTVVFTEDGKKEIKDINSDRDKVWDGIDFREFKGPEIKRKKIRKLILENGSSIKSSAEHQILASKEGEVGFYLQEELKEGDYVALNYNSIPVEGEDIEFEVEQDKDYSIGRRRDEYSFEGNNYKLWELLGYFVGDGFFKKERGIKYSFGNHDEEVKDYIKNIADDIGIELRESLNKKEGYDDCYELTGQKIAYYQLYKKLGMKRGAENKNIPDIVFNQKKEYRRAFVRGLFSSDGWVDTSVSYKTISKELAEDIQLLMNTLGYITSVNKYKDKEDVVSYLITVYEPVKFKEEIGFLQDYYMDKLEEKERKWSSRKISYIPESLYEKYKFKDKEKTRVRYKGGRTRYPKNINVYQKTFPEVEYFNYRWVKVEDNINMNKEEEVYDIYVPETKRFVANGMIVHNSIPKSSSKMWYVHKADEKHKDNPNVLNGYRFSLEEKSDRVAEGFESKLNVRRAFIPISDDFYYVSVDFSSQELRIPTNLCVSYDTKVKTNLGEITLQEVKDALKDDIYVEVKTPVGYKKVNNFYDNGKQSKCKVNLSNGREIICSLDHRFLVKSNNNVYFKKLKNIDIEKEYLVEESDNVSEREIRKALQDR